MQCLNVCEIVKCVSIVLAMNLMVAVKLPECRQSSVGEPFKPNCVFGQFYESMICLYVSTICTLI